MKKSVIDVGSNSIRLLLAECQDGQIIRSTKQLEMTRLALGVDASGYLQEEPMVNTLKAFEQFKADSIAFGAGIPEAFATSAVRDAANGQLFAERAQRETGVPVTIIPGELEAELGFLGALAKLPESVERILVIDIGGGSTECVLGSRQGVEYGVSLKAGSVRMSGRHVQSIPTPDEEIRAMGADIETVVSPIVETLKNASYQRVYGIGGTLTTAAAMVLEMSDYDPEKIQNSEITLEQLTALRTELQKMPLEERQKQPGLQPKRADVIVAGFLIMETLMKQVGCQRFYASDSDNLEGILYKYSLNEDH